MPNPTIPTQPATPATPTSLPPSTHQPGGHPVGPMGIPEPAPAPAPAPAPPAQAPPPATPKPASASAPYLLVMRDANGNLNPNTARVISPAEWQEQRQVLTDHGYVQFRQAE